MLRWPAAAATRLRSTGARTPLRVRLIAVLLSLVAVALTVSGVAAATTLRSYLIGRVDAQLRDAEPAVTQRGLNGVVQASPGDHGAGGPGSPNEHDSASGPQGLPSNYVVEVTDASGAPVYGPTSALVNTSQPLPSLPHAAVPAGATTRAFTVPALSGGTQWRVLSAPVTLTDGKTGALLIAQSLSDVQNTVNRLVLLLSVIGGVTVVALGGVGYVIVRRSMRTLLEVERSAARIAGGDLSHRVPPLADPRTEVGGLSVALNTMLGQIETAFAQRAASAEAARGSEQRMRRFVADASHELRTPLTTIRGFAELYRQGAVPDGDEVRRLMIRIEDEAKRMGLLVEDLLTLARLDQQRPLAQAPVDMLAVARDVVTNARAVDRTRTIGLEVGATDPPPVVIGDEPRLRQVLSNLVTNALQHTPAGTPVTVRISTVRISTVRISTRPSDEAQATVRVAVQDAGPGMAPQDASRVFERFYRADASRARNAGGTGLGLSIVAALVAVHGGRVSVETAPGAGATFLIELPVADEHGNAVGRTGNVQTPGRADLGPSAIKES
jgi:two-component system OmpR family sensor kinase